MSLVSIALDTAVSAIQDNADDLMGCFEALEEYFEEHGIKNSADQHAVAKELSDRLAAIAEWVGKAFPAG
jgi:hypothetical protein